MSVSQEATPVVEPVAVAPASRLVIELARRVAETDCTVLITGESGTGKDVLARFIHRQSPRSQLPFVAVNCAAIPESMLERVLFGFETGVFTGAQGVHAGEFMRAQGGTLLLDEITEMPIALQAKLSRVLQQREVDRVCTTASTYFHWRSRRCASDAKTFCQSRHRFWPRNRGAKGRPCCPRVPCKRCSYTVGPVTPANSETFCNALLSLRTVASSRPIALNSIH
jgi:transcriptional regulator of aromatic amino acid metabolism